MSRNPEAIYAWQQRSRAKAMGHTRKREIEPKRAAKPKADRSRWDAVPLTVCKFPGCRDRAVHRHHCIYAQHVRRAGGDEWDPRNAIGLCMDHHAEVHSRKSLGCGHLPNSVLNFAVETLGHGPAYEYLVRRYPGPDNRLEMMREAADA